MTKGEIVKGLKGLLGIARRNAEIRIASNEQFRELIKGAYELLKPEEAEIEGDPCLGYWYVCPECHVHVKQGTRFCMSCGKEILWK